MAKISTVIVSGIEVPKAKENSFRAKLVEAGHEIDRFSLHHELRPSEIRPMGRMLLVTGDTGDPKTGRKTFASEDIEKAIDDLKGALRSRSVDFGGVLKKVQPIGNAVHDAERIIKENKEEYTRYWD